MSGLLSLLLLLGDARESTAAEKIAVDSAVVTLIEQVDVPAREAGVLSTVGVREGALVTAGALLAQMDDTQAQLAKKRAQIELDTARVEAANDVDVRFAQKSTEVARAELKRASESLEKYKKSVSATELDRLRLEAERAALQVEQAEQVLKVAALTEQLKQNDLDFATASLDRLTIKSPLDGMVVEVNQRPGEWVEPGEAMFRIVRIDRLRVEGFLDAPLAVASLVGRPVVLSVVGARCAAAEFPGKIVFVSPEVDPVNGQVRLWAEVENRTGALRPGLHGTLLIDPPPADAPTPQLPQ